MITQEWAENRLVNMYCAWRSEWCDLLRGFGMKSMRELVGRTDLLVHLDYLDETESAKYQPAPHYPIVQ